MSKNYIPSRDRERCGAYNTAVRKRNREFIRQDKKQRGGCKLCGESHPACLDYHHRDKSEKRLDMCTMGNRTFSLRTIEAELEKCDLLCANCHRKTEYPLVEEAI